MMTNRESWTNDDIIRGYRSQYIIEEVFKQSKDRTFGTLWPQYHIWDLVAAVPLKIVKSMCMPFTVQ